MIIVCKFSLPTNIIYSNKNIEHSTEMEKSNGKAEFDSLDFEKRLTNLKDTQDSIQAMSSWCLQNRVHHKKVVTSWLLVLKQGKSLFL